MHNTMVSPAKLSKYASSFAGQKASLILGIRCIRFLTALRTRPGAGETRALDLALARSPSAPPSLQKVPLSLVSNPGDTSARSHSGVSPAHLVFEFARLNRRNARALRGLPLADVVFFLPLLKPAIKSISVKRSTLPCLHGKNVLLKYLNI